MAKLNRVIRESFLGTRDNKRFLPFDDACREVCEMMPDLSEESVRRLLLAGETIYLPYVTFRLEGL